jgi:hypothetical protein
LNAVLAGTTGIYEDADTDFIAHFKFAYGRTNRCNSSCNFVARDHGKDCWAPFFTSLVNIAVTDSCIGDIESDVMCPNFSAIELVWNERLACFHNGI